MPFKNSARPGNSTADKQAAISLSKAVTSDKPVGQPSRAVVFHLTTLGDLLFSLPLLVGLKQGWPGTRLVGAARAYLLPLLRLTGLVDDVLARPTRFPAKWRLLAALRHERFDLAICLAMSVETMLLARLSGAPRRIGFARSELGSLLTDAVPFDPPPSLANNLGMLDHLGLPRVVEDYVGLIPKDDSATRRAQQLLHAASVDGPYLVVAPGAGPRRLHKAWPPANFGRLADALAREQGFRVAVVGGNSEHEMAAAVQLACPSAVSLVGRTDLLALAEVLRSASLVLANDSGPLHLAAAVEAPTLGIFGPTDSSKTGPCGRLSRFVVAPEGNLSALPPEAVLDAALNLLKDSGRA